MSTQTIEQLFTKYSEGTCTSQEVAEVESLYDYMVRNESLEEALGKLESKYSYLLDKEPVYKVYIRKTAAAAAIIAAAGVGLLFFLKQQHRKNELAITTHITRLVDSGKAVLKLPNGKIIELNNAEDGLLYGFKDGTITKRDGNFLALSNNGATGTLSGQHELFTPKGGEYHLTLPDGSTVQANAATHLRFDPSERDIEVNGEAFLVVHKNPEKPFIVTLRNEKVRVLGTRFNVSNYENEQVKTTVTEGLVQVETNLGNDVHKLKVSASEQVVFDQKNVRKYSRIDTLTAVGWKQGLFAFSQTPIKDALRQLSRWYNVAVDDSGIPDELRVVAQFRKTETLANALKMLNASANLKLEFDGKQIVAK